MRRLAVFKSSRGATLVEIALVLPLLFGSAVACLWVGQLWNADAGISTAVSNGLRAAVTRANPRLGGALLTDEELSKALATSDKSSSYIAYYNAMTQDVFGKDLDELPLHYAYSLAYISQNLRGVVGNSIRFPCDPGGASPEHGSGCLSCRFLEPETLSYVSISNGDSAVDYKMNRIAVDCAFQPTTVLLSPMLKLLGFVGRSESSPTLVVSRKRAFDWSAVVAGEDRAYSPIFNRKNNTAIE